MAFDGLHDFCSLIERDLDPGAEMLHFLQQEIPNATGVDPWQLEAVNSTAGTIAMRVCRQAGKSCVLATRAVRRLKEGHTVLCLAPAERQTREISRKVATYLRATDLIVERATQTEIETSNGGRFIAVPASGATIRGYSVHEIQIDEAAYLPGQNGGEDVIVSVLPMLRDEGNSQVVFASTPAGKNNHFAELFLDRSQASTRSLSRERPSRASPRASNAYGRNCRQPAFGRRSRSKCFLTGCLTLTSTPSVTRPAWRMRYVRDFEPQLHARWPCDQRNGT